MKKKKKEKTSLLLLLLLPGLLRTRVFALTNFDGKFYRAGGGFSDGSNVCKTKSSLRLNQSKLININDKSSLKTHE